MKLTFEQIKSIVRGSVMTESTAEGIRFHRFTQEEEKYYEYNPDFLLKALAASGVQAEFTTDAEEIKIEAELVPGSSRKFFAFDIFVNGTLYAQLKNFDMPMENGVYTTADYPLGVHSGAFKLPDGEKTVRIVFPWTVQVSLKELTLNGASFVKPIKRDRLYIAYGDSITQGYDAVSPSASYANRLAEALGAEIINKGIGAEVFRPELAALADSSLKPSLITVAYGTNDWSKRGKEEYESSCIGFYKNLCERYPDTPVFAISPIWRKDYMDYRPFGSFDGVHEIFRKMCEQCPGVTLINPWEFVPHDVKYYSDLYLHPNDEGFERYAKGLIGSIVK